MKLAEQPFDVGFSLGDNQAIKLVSDSYSNPRMNFLCMQNAKSAGKSGDLVNLGIRQCSIAAQLSQLSATRCILSELLLHNTPGITRRPSWRGMTR